MKKLTQALSALLIASMLAVPVFASSISLRIDNTLVGPTVAPFEHNGTTLVPLRIVSEKLGANVEWNQEAQTITITQGDTIIILTVGSKTAKVNGEAKELLLAPQVKNNTTMVPIRFVSENLNCTVNWDKANQTVSVNSKDVAYEESKGEKVTTFSNPKVIDGTVYLTKFQLIDAFGVTVDESTMYQNYITISRADFEYSITNATDVKLNNIKYGEFLTNLNYGYEPYTGTNQLWVRSNNTNYYPVVHLAKHLNSEVAYDTKTKTLTVVNHGIKRVETVTTDTTTLSGYVYYPDGTPAKGASVVLLRLNEIELLTDEIFTDENGYYEISDFDCKTYERVESSVHVESNSSKDGKYYQGFVPSFATKDEDVEFGFQSNVTRLPDTVLCID